MLWNSSLVMQDVETGTLWSHILGKAMQGPLKGESLQVIPSSLTTWQDWREAHPETTVVLLPRTSNRYRAEAYGNGSRFVLGVRIDGQAKAWPFPDLTASRVHNDVVGDIPLVVWFDPRTGHGKVWERRVDGRALTFEFLSDNEMKDRETGSFWDARRGICVMGPLKGKVLKPVPAIVSFRHAWETFYGRTED